jgi:hypothetical protein
LILDERRYNLIHHTGARRFEDAIEEDQVLENQTTKEQAIRHPQGHHAAGNCTKDDRSQGGQPGDHGTKGSRSDRKEKNCSEGSRSKGDCAQGG